MVAELAKTLLEVMKLAPRFIVALGSASAVLLVLSASSLRRLGLSDVVQKYRFALGLTLVLSVVLIVIYVCLFFIRSIQRHWYRKKGHQKTIKRLNDLTEDEKQILRYFLHHDTRATMLKYDDGVVQGLAHSGIIYQSSSMGDVFEGFPYNITDWTWDYLRANPQALMGTTNFYRTDKGRSWRDPL